MPVSKEWKGVRIVFYDRKGIVRLYDDRDNELAVLNGVSLMVAYDMSQVIDGEDHSKLRYDKPAVCRLEYNELKCSVL